MAFTSSTANSPMLGVGVFMANSTAAINRSTGSYITLSYVMTTSTVRRAWRRFSGQPPVASKTAPSPAKLTINSADTYACYIASTILTSTLLFLRTNITTTGMYAIFTTSSPVISCHLLP